MHPRWNRPDTKLPPASDTATKHMKRNLITSGLSVLAATAALILMRAVVPTLAADNQPEATQTDSLLSCGMTGWRNNPSGLCPRILRTDLRQPAQVNGTAGGQEVWPGRHQHEERLEAHFRLREPTRFYDVHLLRHETTESSYAYYPENSTAHR